MSTPVEEKPQSQSQFPPTYQHPSNSTEKHSEDEGTVVGDGSVRNSTVLVDSRHRANSHLTVQIPEQPTTQVHSIGSPSRVREQAYRLDDDLQLLKIEQQVSRDNRESNDGLQRTRSMHRSQSRRPEPVDDFDVATNPLHEKAALYKPPESPNTDLGRLFKRIHQSSFLVRYFFYITPIVLIILIPLLLGFLLFPNASVGGVQMAWFCIWLEIVWLTLWAGRILAKCLPWPIGAIASLFTNNSKKWRDLGKQLELPATLFFWWLAIEVSFLPTMVNHHLDGNTGVRHWEGTMNKVLVSFFVGAILNFVEKIIIQLIAISFHLRTYADRIEMNKFQINSLVKLYTFSKEKLQVEDKEFEGDTNPPSGARTPGMLVQQAQKNTMEALNKFGDVAGKIAGDFTGKEVTQSTHPHQVILTLLSTNAGSQVLARRLYRTFAREETSTVYSDDLRNAFENDDEADAAFSMFDKDMNGDISMEELEAVCAEIGRERKSITASLKDLDSVVSKLDGVFMFIVAVITILVFISLISTSAAGVLTSAGSTVLALSWLFSATAQELLQSIIFVFVKHPFDVGDRVGVYGNTGSQLKGDDYFVKEISLLYTEFKKLEGHVVQAPNSYLNTLFILNQRRSGGLAEAVPVVIKFGTTIEQIDNLRQRLLDFVISEKREYQGKILTELREVNEAHSLTVNIVFFYKSNWQNELLRLQRRNKFISALMVSMQELGIEGPRMRYPGQKESFPLYMQNIPHVPISGMGHGGTPDDPMGYQQEDSTTASAHPDGTNDTTAAGRSHLRDQPVGILRNGSVAAHQRPRTESLAQMSRRMDFSLGMQNISAASGDMAGDVFEDRERTPLPISITSPSPAGRSTSREGSRRRTSHNGPDTHVSGGLGRSSSFFRPGSQQIGSQLERVGTDSSQARQRPTHRNRFFGVGGGGGSKRRAPTAGADPADQDDMMEMGMADIPEGVSRVPSLRKLDPRSGTISPAAWRASSEDDTRSGSVPHGAGASVSPMARGPAGYSARVDDVGVQVPRRARTDL